MRRFQSKPSEATHKSILPRVVGLVCLALLAAKPVFCAELSIRVTGVVDTKGEIGCQLFSSSEGFPLDGSKAKLVSTKPHQNKAQCRFENLSPGTYAVAVGHDLNGNQKVDTNFFGLPTEAWGVSKNIRHSLKAPSFEEASFKITQGQEELVLEINIAK